MSADAELRIRLEGRLEVLEQTTAQLERLLALAHPGWHDEPRVLLDELDAWSDGAAARHDALRAAEREAGARRWLDAVRERQVTLSLKLDRLLHDTAVVRRRALDAKLATWAELARSFGVVHEGQEPIASGEGVQRSREWLVTVGAAAAVFAMSQPQLVLLLAPIAVVWWDFCKSTIRWRMFKDCIELTEPDRPVRRVPLESIEELDGDSLRALWDLSLRGESGFLELAVDVRRALTVQKTRLRYGEHASHALWIPGSLHPDDTGAARAGARPQHGWLLSCPRGMVFVPDAATSLAWYVAMGAPPLDAQADIGAELRALPEALLDEKVGELGRLKGCVALTGLQHAAFQSLGEILLIEVDAKRRLFVRCSLATQAKLLERV